MGLALSLLQEEESPLPPALALGKLDPPPPCVPCLASTHFSGWGRDALRDVAFLEIAVLGNVQRAIPVNYSVSRGNDTPIGFSVYSGWNEKVWCVCMALQRENSKPVVQLKHTHQLYYSITG